MKFRNNIILTLSLLVILSACRHDITMETTVYPDGSLDKTIRMAEIDSLQNIMGLRQEDGWVQTIQEVEKTENDKGNEFYLSPRKPADIAPQDSSQQNSAAPDSSFQKPSTRKEMKKIRSFKRHFSSVEEANAALATPADTLLRVTSTFEKKFRWFYTYIYYADTYHAINHLDYPIQNYVTTEDYAFIDRLPAEGKKITSADSLYLLRLNEKLFDIYGTRAWFEAYYDISIKLLQQHNLENRWLDTLQAHKESIFKQVVTQQDIDARYMAHVLDSIGIPISPVMASKSYRTMLKPLESKLQFISIANDAKYHHQIKMPWGVVRTNADSISGSRLFWNPPSIKFLLKDYTLYAESRQLNYWAVATSAVVIALTTFLFVRRRRV